MSGLVNLVHNGFPERSILRIVLTEENILGLVRGDESYFITGEKENYQTSMKRIMSKARDEALDMILEYKPTVDKFNKIKFAKSREEKLRGYKEIMNDDPKHSLARLYAAVILLNDKEYPEAETLLREAIELRPNDPRILNQLGVLFDRTNLVTSSQMYYEQALEVDPTYSKSLYNFGLLLERKGDTNKSRELFLDAAARGNVGAKEKLIN